MINKTILERRRVGLRNTGRLAKFTFCPKAPFYFFSEVRILNTAEKQFEYSHFKGKFTYQIFLSFKLNLGFVSSVLNFCHFDEIEKIIVYETVVVVVFQYKVRECKSQNVSKNISTMHKDFFQFGSFLLNFPEAKL